MNTRFTMTPEESNIRAEVRTQYRNEGNTENPYPFGSPKALYWESEESRIWIESMESM
jgi:hypothetical protein